MCWMWFISKQFLNSKNDNVGKTYINIICLVLGFSVWNKLEASYSHASNEHREYYISRTYSDAINIGTSESTGDTRGRSHRVSEYGAGGNIDWDSKMETRTIDAFQGDLGRQTVPSRVPVIKEISKYVSYHEATYSSTAARRGINNHPSENQLRNLVNLGVNFFDKLREHFNRPIYITSFFRSAELNKAVDGALYSDHMANGNDASVDIDMDGRGIPTNNALFFYVKSNMQFYKLIAEFPVNGKMKWAHVSYSRDPLKNYQRNVFIAVYRNNRKVYLPYKGNEHLIK